MLTGGNPHQGWRSGGTDPGYRIFFRTGDCGRCVLKPVAGHHLHCHLANPPSVILQGCLDRGEAPRRTKRRAGPSSAQTLDQSGGPAGSPVTAHRAGGPPRVRTSRGSTSPPLSGSMHPANVRGRAKVRKLLLDALPRSLAVRGRRASTDGERRCSPDRVALRTDATLIGKAKAFVPELVVRRDCGGKDGAPAVGTAGALWDRTSCATSATGCGP
jgi:hypothetical protein